MEYNWIISSINAKISDGELSNVIETIHWRLQASEGKDLVDTYGSLELEAPNTENFKPFEDITKADIESWLDSKLDVESLKSSLDSKLEAIKNPTHRSLTLVS